MFAETTNSCVAERSVRAWTFIISSRKEGGEKQRNKGPDKGNGIGMSALC